MTAADAIALAWQSSLLLALGLLASRLLRRRAARAHLALLLAIGASLGAPLLSTLVRSRGWGALPGPEWREDKHASLPIGRLAMDELPIARAPAAADAARDSAASGDVDPSRMKGREPGLQPETTGSRPATSRVTAPSVVWLLVGLSLSASVVAALRLLRSWLQGRGLVARARPVTSGPLVQALERAAVRLALRPVPVLAVSDEVSCPMLWPWTRGGLLLVPPAGAVRGPGCVDWDAVLAHELAHLRRADHRGLLAGHGLVVLLPWQPLAWWCRRRLLRLAELACDDWVVASGHAPADYADSLLAFAPATRRGWTMAAVSDGGTLRQRIERILGERRAAPAPGRAWVGATAAVAALLVVVLACAQPGPARTIEAETTPAATPAPSEPPLAPPARKPSSRAATEPQLVTVVGRVVDESGVPISGAEVRASQAQLNSEPKFTVVHTTRSDAEGAFRFDLSSEQRHWHFSADRDGYAHQWLGEVPCDLSAQPRESLTLVLQKPVELSGTVRDPDGRPIDGARVIVTREYVEDSSHSLFGSDDMDLAVATTDADGHFDLERLRTGWVRLMLDHPDYVRTMTPHDDPVATGRNDVELVMHRGRTLKGRLTADGQPLGGVSIKGSANRLVGSWNVRTDSDGLFELHGIPSSSGRPKRLSRYIELLSLETDAGPWWSARYRVYDEGKPELPFVEIEAESRATRTDVGIDELVFVNAPTNGDEARGAGEPVGDATLEVTLVAPPQDRYHRFREIWIDGNTQDSQPLHRRAPVNRDGRVVFDQLPAGQYTLWLPGTEPPAIPTVPVGLSDGETRQVTLEPGPVRVHGNVSCGGKPVTQGNIVVYVFETGSSRFVLQAAGVVHPDGTWEAPGLPMGRYTIVYEGEHSVPNRFSVEGAIADTRLDLELPQTRIDVVLSGRDYKPADYAELAAESDDDFYFLRAFPGGSMPQGGNTGGNISVGDGQPFVEHLPPGRWSLFTGSGAAGREGRLVARVRLESDTSRVTAELRPSDGGTGVIKGLLNGLDTTKFEGEEQPLWICAFAKDDDGLDTSVWFGAARSQGTSYGIWGLPAGRYGVLIGPSGSLTRTVRGELEPMPWIYLPDLEVGDGETLVRDVDVPAMRTVVLDPHDGQSQNPMATWRIDLGGGDWLPFNLLIGSSPQANIAGPTPFGLPVGEHRLEISFSGKAPDIRTIRVEPGAGVQEIQIVRGAN